MNDLTNIEKMCNDLQTIVKEYDLTANRTVTSAKGKKCFVITSHNLASELLSKVFERIGQRKYVFEHSTLMQCVILRIYLTD